MKPISATTLVVGLYAAVLLACSSAASAGQLGNVPADQNAIQSRIDQLAQPRPQPSGQPGEPAATAPVPGSFPRSFLIPGTDTSVRIGGSVDGTATYYGH
jgi:hypothetical protein